MKPIEREWTCERCSVTWNAVKGERTERVCWLCEKPDRSITSWELNQRESLARGRDLHQRQYGKDRG